MICTAAGCCFTLHINADCWCWCLVPLLLVSAGVARDNGTCSQCILLLLALLCVAAACPLFFILSSCLRQGIPSPQPSAIVAPLPRPAAPRRARACAPPPLLQVAAAPWPCATLACRCSHPNISKRLPAQLSLILDLFCPCRMSPQVAAVLWAFATLAYVPNELLQGLAKGWAAGRGGEQGPHDLTAGIACLDLGSWQCPS